MNTNDRKSPRWSTSAFGGTTQPQAPDLTLLKAQLDECNASRGRWFGLCAAADHANAFLAARIVTTLLLVVILAVAVVLVLSAWPGLG